MENTARKLSAEDIIQEANKTHGSLDLLRVFLITNSADIIREYEFFSKLLKNNPSEAERATYTHALKTLVNVSLKRIELTDAIYKANESANAISVEEIVTEPEAKSIMMLPSLDDIVNRVRVILKDGNNTGKSHDDAFELLKTTVGQGRVLNADGKPETWDNNQIQGFIKDNAPEVEESAEEVKPGDKFGFNTIHSHFMTMVEAGKKEPEIKESLRVLLMGKIISGKDTTSDYLIKDDAVFEDYYTRILGNIINITITAFENKPKENKPTGKFEDAEKKVVEEISPILAEQDKDETISSFANVTKKAKEIYASFGFKKSLSDTLIKVQEIAEKVAPNLYTRNKATSKSNTPTVEKKAVEIYDETHNIKETNAELWAEVEKYEYLDQIFKKGVELSLAGFWKDALSMTIILISSGKIKETETSTEVLKWDVDQIKLWYHSNVEIAVTEQQNKESEKTEDTKAEIIDEKKDIIQQETAKTEENSEGAKEEPKKFGPVPQSGSIESNENVVRLLKEPTLWKDKYSFKSFIVKTDHHNSSSMALEIVDATEEQEKDLLITEANITKFFDGLVQQLVVRRNDEPLVRKTISETLSPFYELTNSEAKRITGALVKEADGIRREIKKSQKASNKVEDAKKSETSKEETTEAPEKPKEEEVASPPAQESVEQKEEIKEIDPQSTENLENESTPNTTENPAGEEHTNSNDDESSEEPPQGEPLKEEISYDGFENIVNARKKYDFDVAVYKKISEYTSSEEGIKAVFDIVNVARKDNHFKKSFIRNHKGADKVDLLSTIHKIYTTGTELAKKQ